MIVTQRTLQSWKLWTKLRKSKTNKIFWISKSKKTEILIEFRSFYFCLFFFISFLFFYFSSLRIVIVINLYGVAFTV